MTRSLSAWRGPVGCRRAQRSDGSTPNGERPKVSDAVDAGQVAIVVGGNHTSAASGSRSSLARVEPRPCAARPVDAEPVQVGVADVACRDLAPSSVEPSGRRLTMLTAWNGSARSAMISDTVAAVELTAIVTDQVRSRCAFHRWRPSCLA